MDKNLKPKIIYGPLLAKTYEQDRRSTLADVIFWKKEQQELNHAINSLEFPVHKILEAGCGTGRFIRDLAKGESLFFGLDLSPYMLATARKNLRGKLFTYHLIQASVSNLPFKDGAFDFIYCIRVMNQLPSKVYALCALLEFCRVCKIPGGILTEYINEWGLSRFSQKSFTRLQIKDIKRALHQRRNCNLLYMRGILFFSQTLWNLLPKSILLPIVKLDVFICRFLPLFSTRCYVLINKKKNYERRL